MSTVQEIERAIEKLSAEEVEELKAWLFDREIEADAQAGRLDTAADQALRELHKGHTRPLWRIGRHRPFGRCTTDSRSRLLADKQFELLKSDPRNPLLQVFVWFWIGDHKEYERLIR